MEGGIFWIVIFLYYLIKAFKYSLNHCLPQNLMLQRAAPQSPCVRATAAFTAAAIARSSSSNRQLRSDTLISHSKYLPREEVPSEISRDHTKCGQIVHEEHIFTWTSPAPSRSLSSSAGTSANKTICYPESCSSATRWTLIATLDALDAIHEFVTVYSPTDQDCFLNGKQKH